MTCPAAATPGHSESLQAKASGSITCRGVVRPIRLKARNRIRIGLAAVEPVFVAGSYGHALRKPAEVALRFGFEWNPLFLPLNRYFYLLVIRRPDPKMNAARRRFRPHRQPPARFVCHLL